MFKCRQAVLVYLPAFAILFFVTVAAQKCILNPQQIVDYQRIYLTKNGGHWSLLHTDALTAQQPLYAVCDETEFEVVACATNRGEFNTTLPISTNCTHPPIRAMVRRMNDRRCSEVDGDLFRISYKIASDFLDIYEVCFNTAAVHPIYAIHQVYAFNVTASQYKRPTFTTDRLISGASKAAFKPDKIYAQFNSLLGAQQSFIKHQKALVIERGHLAPAGDFISYDQTRETFKLINVVPQFGAINRSNWKRIEAWIKKLPRGTQSVTVLTGVHDVLQLPHSQAPHHMVSMYLQSHDKIPIPKWMFKVVKHNGGICTVVVTYNNQFATTNDLPAPICATQATCPTALKFNANPSAGYSYCCNYTEFIRVVGPHAAIC